MFPTLTSDEQRRVKQQILVAFEQGCSVQDLCWLLGTSVLKIDDFALDLLIFLGAVAFTVKYG